MSSKKDKLLESAQKFVVKGQLDKAIKEYEQLLALDPSAIAQRQKMAELLVRCGRPDEARTELELVGKHFSSNGFHLKAIAVYKQLQNLFPSEITIAQMLAAQYEKHGLVANALEEYNRVYSYFDKAGNTVDALKTLDKMQTVDPKNLSIKAKLAEEYFKGGFPNESYSTFSKLAAQLQERGDTAACAKLDSRIQQLFPEKAGFMLEILTGQVSSGNAAAAVNGLQALLRTNPKDKRIWELIIEAYTQLNLPQKVKLAYQHFLNFFPDENKAIAGYINAVAEEKDLKGTLELLDKHEAALLSGGMLADLEKVYRILDAIDPINIRVIQGLKNVLAASGKADEAAVYEAKIKSLQNLSSPSPIAAPEKPSLQEKNELPAHDFGEISFADIDDEKPSPFSVAVEEEETLPPMSGSFADQNDEIDIDVDVDVEFDFDDTEDVSGSFAEQEEVPAAIEEENWLDKVAEFFDGIASKPRGVKFDGSLDAADSQAHYDLGVAFREMGLFDEAVNEFRQASVDEERRHSCYVLQGACLRDKGDLANAEKVLSMLIHPSLDLEHLCSAKYELALIYDANGNSERLVQLLTEIRDANPGFRDVQSRLEAARSGDQDFEFSDDDLLDFELK